MTWQDDARAAAIRHGIDPDIFVAQIQAESGGNPNAVSPAGAEGIAQFMPGTSAGLGIDPYNQYQALDAAAGLMAGYVNHYGDYATALAAYNMGPGGVDNVIAGNQQLPQETYNYIHTVLGNMTGLNGGSGASQMASNDKYIRDADGNITGLNPNYDPNAPNPQAENLPGLVLSNGAYHVGSASGPEASPSQIQHAIDIKYPNGAPNGITASDVMAAATQMRGQDVTAAGNQLSYNASIYGTNAASASSAANLAENVRQFDESQAFAKEKWIFEKQNAIDTLQVQRDQLATVQASNARNWVMENEKLNFAKDQFAFTSALDLRAETRATQTAMFDQQATVAQLQMNEVAIKQHTAELNAQLRQEVAIFNAGKAADVSMFNIDEQTKVATFNAEAAQSAAIYNSQMGFEVQKANVENERLLQQQKIDVAKAIADAAANPGDYGKLNALILALGGGANIGATDAALATTDLRTTASMTPLEAMLRQREDIMTQNPDPFSFERVTPQTVAPPPLATFTPAVAAQAPAPDFSGVKLPTPNVTPFDPNSIPTQGVHSAPTNDSTVQTYIATGNTSVPGEQFKDANGNPLTAEQRAAMPDFAKQGLIDSGYIPAAATGGIVSDGMVTPFGSTPNASRVQGAQNMVDKFNTVRSARGMPTGGASIPAGEQPGSSFPVDTQGATQYARNAMDWRSGGTTGWPAQQNTQVQGAGGAGDWQSHLPTWMQGGQQGQPWTGQGWQQMIQQLFAHLGRNLPTGMAGQGGAEQYAQNVYGNIPPQYQQFVQRMFGGMQHAASGGSMKGAFVAGDNPNGPDAEEIVIPTGPGQAVVLSHKQTEKVLKNGKKAKAPKKMATGGVFDPNSLANTPYEGLLSDTDRTRATNFLANATDRATRAAGFAPGRLPTPVFYGAPGTSRFAAQLGASLNALGRGIPQDYFLEQAQRAAPAGYSEGVIGRTR